MLSQGGRWEWTSFRNSQVRAEQLFLCPNFVWQPYKTRSCAAGREGFQCNVAAETVAAARRRAAHLVIGVPTPGVAPTAAADQLMDLPEPQATDKSSGRSQSTAHKKPRLSVQSPAGRGT